MLSRVRSSARIRLIVEGAQGVFVNSGAHRLRSYKIVVDGEVAATLGRREHAAVTVSGGHHSVSAKLDWGSSANVEIELGENDRAYLICQSGFQPSLARPRALLYITIWRKRYLDLQLLRVESRA